MIISGSVTCFGSHFVGWLRNNKQHLTVKGLGSTCHFGFQKVAPVLVQAQVVQCVSEHMSIYDW